MTPARSIVGNIATSRWLHHAWRRRIIALVLTILFTLIALFPRPYRAAVSLAPTDPAMLGLGGALGQTSAYTSVFGNQAAIEIGLKVARSQQTRLIVAKKLDIIHRLDFGEDLAADRWLSDNVDIRALRGGLVQIEVLNTDPKLGIALVNAFANATRDRLGQIARSQAEYKREVLVELVMRSRARLAKARGAYDAFRRETRYTAPTPSLAGIGQRVPMLRDALKSKEVALSTARAFATDDNMQVRQILTEIKIIREQLAEAESLNATAPYSVNRVVIESTKVQQLERELAIAQSQYDNYRLFLEGTDVEDLTSTGNIRILEPPYIDSARQYRTVPAAIALLIFLLAISVELYLLRPPLENVRMRRLEEA